MEGPEGLERRLPGVLSDHLALGPSGRGILTVADQPQGDLAPRLVRFFEHIEQLPRREFAVVELASQLCRLLGVHRSQPIDAAALLVHAPLIMARVVDPLLVEVGYINAAIWAD